MREKAKVVLVLMEDDEKLKEEREFARKTREKTSKGSAGEPFFLTVPTVTTVKSLYLQVSQVSFSHFTIISNQPHRQTPSRIPTTNHATFLEPQGFHPWTIFPQWPT